MFRRNICFRNDSAVLSPIKSVELNILSEIVVVQILRRRLSKEKDRLSMMDDDGDSLQEMQMYSPSQWSKQSGLHSLGGKGSFIHRI